MTSTRLPISQIYNFSNFPGVCSALTPTSTVSQYDKCWLEHHFRSQKTYKITIFIEDLSGIQSFLELKVKPYIWRVLMTICRAWYLILMIMIYGASILLHINKCMIYYFSYDFVLWGCRLIDWAYVDIKSKGLQVMEIKGFFIQLIVSYSPIF